MASSFISAAQTATSIRRFSQDTISWSRPYRYTRPDTSEDHTYGYFFTLPLEFPIVENHDLDNALTAAGYPKCTLPVVTPGFGLQVQLYQFIGTLSYNRSTSRPKSDSVALAISYRAISIGVGYDVLRHPYYSLFPYLGFKFCKTSYRYNEKVTDTPTLSNYLQTNLDYKELTNSPAHLDLGLGASYQTLYLIGLRAGILLPMGKAQWYINNNKVAIGDSPGFRYQGYVALTVGLGESTSSRRDRQRAERIRERDGYRPSLAFAE
jgi:hypothetical protein